MISEAVTMVMADMAFVDSLNRSGLAYDYSKRRIYPLFQSIQQTVAMPDERTRVVAALHATVDYALRGDDRTFRYLLEDSENGLSVLEKFKLKYMPFFVEDFRWTQHNWESIATRAEEFRRWWDLVKPLREKFLPDLMTIDEFAALTDSSEVDLVKRVFSGMFAYRIEPFLTRTVMLDPATARNLKARMRHMMGQLAIFSRYHFVPDALKQGEMLVNDLLALDSESTSDGVHEIRSRYDAFLDHLHSHHLLVADDYLTFREFFPLFDPYYVNYGRSFDCYEDLRVVSTRLILGNP